MGSLTASIIIIGDEILKGQTQDTNSHFFCRELYDCGIKVKKVSVIPDDIDVIAEEVKLLLNSNTYVLTSGGVGPTHDDVTYAGIAKAFGEKLVKNSKLVQIYCELGLDEGAASKLSLVPISSVVHETKTPENETFIPMISVKNVFVFPGIPSYLKGIFLSIKQNFVCNKSFCRRDVYLYISEFRVLDALNKAVSEFSPETAFGSYPNVDKSSPYKVKLTLESKCKDLLNRAEGYLRSVLPENSTVYPKPLKSQAVVDELYTVISNSSIDKHFVNVLKESVEVIEKCLNRYDPKNICLSFNGGKDCTVLLHLVHCMLVKNDVKMKLKTLYVHSEQSFPDADMFLQLCITRYDLEVIQYDYPIIDALAKLKVDYPNIASILIGTRHTDPHAQELQLFQMTDGDWPQFMRVSPLLHWSYNDVWQFLRMLNLPYCSLYDQGYTSLGCKATTVPNPKLKMNTKTGITFYGPAFLLKEHSEERNGRV